MINRLLTWFKRKPPELDINDFIDFQESVEDLEMEVESLKDALNLKEKEYQTLLSKYINLKVEKDITV